MRQVPISMVQPGSILAVNIYSKGRTLYRKGHQLSRSDIRSLQKAGVRSLSITDESEVTPKKSGLLSDEARNTAVQAVYDVFNDFENFSAKKHEKIVKTAEVIVDDILDFDDMKIQTHDLRTFDDYTYRHSVNVTAISVAVGRLMKLNKSDLTTLAVGGLMHDIGKMKIPESILRKQSGLNDEEREMVQKHPNWGFEMLRTKTQSSPVVWGLARQHHETMDGAGYPDRRSGEEIHPWARIVAVADVWDALRSERPYKPGWPADRVLKFLNSEEVVRRLDDWALEIMNKIAVPFPRGAVVKLSNGMIGVVTSCHPNELDKPVIKIIEMSMVRNAKAPNRKSISPGNPA